MQHGEWEKKNAVRILPLFFSNIERRLNCPSFRLQYFHIVCFKQTLHTIWNNNMRITFYMFLNESHIPPFFVWWIKTQHNYHQFLLRKKKAWSRIWMEGSSFFITVSEFAENKFPPPLVVSKQKVSPGFGRILVACWRNPL